jgi:uncharacterized protein (TIGR03435 family)
MERLLFEFGIRTILIAAATGAALWLLRIRTAAARHAAWSGVMLAMLLLPAWVAWGPKAEFKVPPLAEPAGGRPVLQGYEIPAAVPIPSGRNWGPVCIGVYLLGAMTLLLRLAIGTILANRLTGAVCAAPVTVGLLRPRIILPECSSEWPEALLNAVLTHEGEHVRRRDPLVHWLALFNRAVFWPHPLAWWLERQIAALAEEACDAAVLARGYDAAEYSGYLLELARSVERAGKRVNVVAMAMPGSALPQRLGKLAAGVYAPRISRIRLTCAVLACAIPTAVIAAGRLDHTPRILPLRPLPARAVPRPPVLIAQAHVAPATVTANGPERSAYTKIPMHQLLAIAYGLKQPYLLLGLSAGEENTTYDISAQISPGATEERLQAMVQNLLIERFNLKVHRESRNQSEYELVVAPGGLKMKESDGANPIPRASLGASRWMSLAGGMSTGTIALECQNMVRRPVVDKTGLSGKYEVNVYVVRIPAPEIFAAIEQQLGLRLDPIDIPVDVLVVDQLGPVPTRN